MLDRIGQNSDYDLLKNTVPEPKQIKLLMSAADKTLIDGKQRIVRYTSSAPGFKEHRISIIKKIDNSNICCVIRRDRRHPSTRTRDYECQP